VTLLPKELLDLIATGPLASIEPSDETWALLDRLCRVYVALDVEFPAPKKPGHIVRYRVDRVGGVGPWTTA
jgi:hypothetical protein